jgi:glycosyltransferase involved in cell wall biosynthesis
VRAVHVVVPDGIDDPARPSGGNTYDRHLCRELGAIGWSVHEHAVPGFWTSPSPASFAALDAQLQRIPDGAVVLLDGLIASTAPDVLVPQARRLRTVVLVHMPLGHRPPDQRSDDARRREGQVLRAAGSVLATSDWARRRLVELYALPAHRVHAAEPGVEPAELATGTPAGGALLCVATVSFAKGHDILLDALCGISDLTWRCACVGRLDREPGFVDGLRRRALNDALRDRVSFRGPRTGTDLDRDYGSADLLVLASRVETYGMVVSEALARGVPVIAADVGGLSEAVGQNSHQIPPGLLVAPEDSAALGAALRAWLCDPELRTQLRRAARERRATLPRWLTTACVVAGVLAAVGR